MSAATAELFLASSDSEIEACFEAFSALRPHVKREQFLSLVRRQERESYRILAVRADGLIPCVGGFRLAHFLAWGKVLYIDDLSTVPEARGRGYASAVLQWLTAHARSLKCDAVHLDSGYARHAAHRLYLNSGFRLSSHHFSLELSAS